MNTIINKLSEIETAAASIVNHAEAEKDTLDRKMSDITQKFDEQLNADTKEKLAQLQQECTEKIDIQLEQLKAENAHVLHSLTKDYESNHEQYAQEILRRIIEV